MRSDLPLLDIYVLSLLDRGMTSYYDLQRQGRLSLGASTPALERLRKRGLVTRAIDRSKGKRKKFHFELTPTGSRAAPMKWRPYFVGQPPADIDSVLRVIDLALHYGVSKGDVAAFAMKAAEARIIRSKQVNPQTGSLSGTAVHGYLLLRSECDYATLKAEAGVLEAIAVRLAGISKPERKAQRKSRRRKTIYSTSPDQRSLY